MLANELARASYALSRTTLQAPSNFAEKGTPARGSDNDDFPFAIESIFRNLAGKVIEKHDRSPGTPCNICERIFRVLRLSPF